MLVYIYRGGGEEEVSEDVIKVIVDSSVTEIAEETFKYCRKLKSVVRYSMRVCVRLEGMRFTLANLLEVYHFHQL